MDLKNGNHTRKTWKLPTMMTKIKTAQFAIEYLTPYKAKLHHF